MRKRRRTREGKAASHRDSGGRGGGNGARVSCARSRRSTPRIGQRRPHAARARRGSRARCRSRIRVLRVSPPCKMPKQRETGVCPGVLGHDKSGMGDSATRTAHAARVTSSAPHLGTVYPTRRWRGEPVTVTDSPQPGPEYGSGWGGDKGAVGGDCRSLDAWIHPFPTPAPAAPAPAAVPTELTSANPGWTRWCTPRGPEFID